VLLPDIDDKTARAILKNHWLGRPSTEIGIGPVLFRSPCHRLIKLDIVTIDEGRQQFSRRKRMAAIAPALSEDFKLLLLIFRIAQEPSFDNARHRSISGVLL